MNKTLRFASVSALCNMAYSAYHFVLGFVSDSWWLLTLGCYYLILSAVRFFVLLPRRNEGFAIKFTGLMLIFLSIPLAGTVILSVMEDRGQKFHMIVMIAMAAYAFANITMATVNFIRSRHIASAQCQMLRNISFANAFVSIFALQRSMLVTFEGMGAQEILLFNILTGTAVWIIVLLLGINLIGGKYIDMAKAKIVNVNNKIAETVTDGYRKIEKGVVNSYKTIEKGVVAGYTRIEDRFVNTFLAKMVKRRKKQKRD